MDADELDLAISDLETRLERLRSLYEQYFLGIEKIPPQVARKDVDRRIWELRRVKIRNTAKRFKLQTIVQRYNTFQQYWQRILREIENGTYKRHLLRAERTTGKSTREAPRDQNTPVEAADARAEDPNAAAQLGRLLDSGSDLDHELERALAEVSASQPPGADWASARAESAPAVRATGRRAVETLDLDMDGFDVGSSAKGPAAPAPRTPAGGTGELGTPPPRPQVGASAARAPRGPTAGAQARSSAVAQPTRKNPLAALGTRKAQPASPRAKPPVPTRPAEANARAKAAGRPPVNSAEAAKAGAARGATPKGLTDQRIAELHNRLLAAKRQTREGGKVSVKGLAKSLRAAESKLRKQHKNRRVDFDIVIKDGRAVVKPFLR